MWHPSAKLSVTRNRSKGKSDGFCHQDHARQHEIESEWDMVAFDIAGRAVSRTTGPVVFTHEGRSCRHVGRGVVLSRSIRRRMSANRSRGIATSAMRDLDTQCASMSIFRRFKSRRLRHHGGWTTERFAETVGSAARASNEREIGPSLIDHPHLSGDRQ